MKPTRFVFLVAALVTLGACSDNNAKKKSEAPPVPVTATNAEESDVPVTLKVVGRAEAYESVALKSRVDGQVSDVLFTEGQRVNKGDILIRLDPTDFAAKLQQLEAAAARDEALIAKTRADTARYSALKDRNFVSEEKVNDIRTNEAAATANLRASKAAAEVARLQLSYTTIRAPITGVVGARVVFPGSAVKINETTLAVVNRIRPLLVAFSVPEKHLSRLRAAMKQGEMKVDISLPSDPSQRFEGKVIFIDNAVDSASGTILMKASLPNDDEKLTPGQFLNVSLILETLQKAVTVPNAAIQQGVDSKFVYVIKDEGSVEMRSVEIAASDGRISAIGKGIDTGETVVTDGHLRLTPGAKVKIKEAESGKKPQKTDDAPPSRK